jgi:hypothetical protein
MATLLELRGKSNLLFLFLVLPRENELLTQKNRENELHYFILSVPLKCDKNVD